MSDPEAAAVEYLVGVRLREVAKAEDYLVAEDLELHVGDLVMVSMEGGQTVGEVRRPRRLLPDFKRDRPVRPAALLLVLPPQVRADLRQDGEDPGHAAHR